jgi:hypothetical protein
MNKMVSKLSTQPTIKQYDSKIHPNPTPTISKS